jgi:hypothetical protein
LFSSFARALLFSFFYLSNMRACCVCVLQSSGPGYGGLKGSSTTSFLYGGAVEAKPNDLWRFTLTGSARSGVVLDAQGHM